jgi:hypothetical protein
MFLRKDLFLHFYQEIVFEFFILHVPFKKKICPKQNLGKSDGGMLSTSSPVTGATPASVIHTPIHLMDRSPPHRYVFFVNMLYFAI